MDPQTSRYFATVRAADLAAGRACVALPACCPDLARRARRRCLWLSGNRLIAWLAQVLSRIIDDRVSTACRPRADHEPTACRPRADHEPTTAWPTTRDELSGSRAGFKPDDEPIAATNSTSSASRPAVHRPRAERRANRKLEANRGMANGCVCGQPPLLWLRWQGRGGGRGARARRTHRGARTEAHALCRANVMQLASAACVHEAPLGWA